MGRPNTPLTREARDYFVKKLQRGERFHSKEEKKKMVKRVSMYDNGFRGTEAGVERD